MTLPAINNKTNIQLFIKKDNGTGTEACFRALVRSGQVSLGDVSQQQ